jgi:hypothetical protein
MSQTKKLLETLGVSIVELSYLLLISPKTLTSWLNRQTIIPTKHSEYFTAFELYRNARGTESLNALDAKWKEEDAEPLLKRKSKELKKLNVAIRRCEFKLMQLKKKSARLVSRGHFADELPNYLSPERRENPDLQAWLSLLRQSTQFKHSDIRLEICRYEQQLAGLKAEADYWAK